MIESAVRSHDILIKSNIIVRPTTTATATAETNQSSIMYSSPVVWSFFFSSRCWKLARKPQIIGAGLGAVQLASQRIFSPPCQYRQPVSTFRDAIV
jgi:hypothetical protein